MNFSGEKYKKKTHTQILVQKIQHIFVYKIKSFSKIWMNSRWTFPWNIFVKPKLRHWQKYTHFSLLSEWMANEKKKFRTFDMILLLRWFNKIYNLELVGTIMCFKNFDLLKNKLRYVMIHFKVNIYRHRS